MEDIKATLDRGTVLQMIGEYETVFWHRGYSNPVVGASARFPEDGDLEKAMRWLGFMQGYSVAKGIYSLDEVKRHRRKGTLVGDEEYERSLRLRELDHQRRRG